MGLIAAGEVHSDAGIACIGPVTADAAKAASLSVAVMPETYTVSGLVAALRHVFRG
jgi:uroporphyrinogen-III synthase